MLRGVLALHRSSQRVLRGFCASCGTALTYAHDARPAEIDVAVAALGDGLPQHAGWRDAPG
jgi:hypothetical protein